MNLVTPCWRRVCSSLGRVVRRTLIALVTCISGMEVNAPSTELLHAPLEIANTWHLANAWQHTGTDALHPSLKV